MSAEWIWWCFDGHDGAHTTTATVPANEYKRVGGGRCKILRMSGARDCGVEDEMEWEWGGWTRMEGWIPTIRLGGRYKA
jgi:hypothetical protein